MENLSEEDPGIEESVRIIPITPETIKLMEHFKLTSVQGVWDLIKEIEKEYAAYKIEKYTAPLKSKLRDTECLPLLEKYNKIITNCYIIRRKLNGVILKGEAFRAIDRNYGEVV